MDVFADPFPPANFTSSTSAPHNPNESQPFHLSSPNAHPLPPPLSIAKNVKLLPTAIADREVEGHDRRGFRRGGLSTRTPNRKLEGRRGRAGEGPVEDRGVIFPSESRAQWLFVRDQARRGGCEGICAGLVGTLGAFRLAELGVGCGGLFWLY